MEMAETKFKIGMALEVPTVPNFVRISGTMNSFPVHRMTDAEIVELGKAWTEKLLAHARKQRKTLL